MHYRKIEREERTQTKSERRKAYKKSSAAAGIQRKPENKKSSQNCNEISQSRLITYKRKQSIRT